MNVIKAMEETVRLAADNGMPAVIEVDELSFLHLCSMLERMQEGNFSYGKQCRWLGWAQCAVVAAGCATLEDMKQINMRNKD